MRAPSSPAPSFVDLGGADADDDHASVASHMTSALLEHESAFRIQRIYRDHLASKRVEEPLPQLTSNAWAGNFFALCCAALVALSLFTSHKWSMATLPPQPPPQPDPFSQAWAGFLRGAAGGAAAGGGVGLFFPMAAPVEIAFGGLVGGLLGAVQSFSDAQS